LYVVCGAVPSGVFVARCKDTRLLFTEVIPHLHHENDGVIFTPVDQPYHPGRLKIKQNAGFSSAGMVVVCVRVDEQGS
jgi:hypothetical protein